MNNILVTNAEGQLGSTTKELVKNSTGYIYVYTDSETVDITKENDVTAFVNRIYFDYFLYCEAYTVDYKAEIELFCKINADTVQILSKTSADYRCVLIHIATDFVFDGKKNSAYLEINRPNPLNVYVVSKLKGQKYVQEYLETYFMARSTSSGYSDYGNNFVNTMLKSGKQRKRLDVISAQYGSTTHVVDFVEFNIELAHKYSQDFGMYHFSNKGITSWYDFSTAMIAHLNHDTIVYPILAKDYAVREVRPQNSAINIFNA